MLGTSLNPRYPKFGGCLIAGDPATVSQGAPHKHCEASCCMSGSIQNHFTQRSATCESERIDISVPAPYVHAHSTHLRSFCDPCASSSRAGTHDGYICVGNDQGDARGHKQMWAKKEFLLRAPPAAQDLCWSAALSTPWAVDLVFPWISCGRPGEHPVQGTL